MEAMSEHVTGHLSLTDHFEALRSTLIRVLLIIVLGVGFSFAFYQPLFSLLSAPFYALSNQQSADLVVLGPVDGIGIVLKVSFWCGLIVTSPLWMYELFRFIAPGLRSSERRVVFPFTLLSIVFLSAGIGFSYYLTLPLANRFFFHFNEGLGKNLWSLASYFDYTLFLLLANGLAFELCALFFLLVHYGVVTRRWISQKRRVAWVSIWVLSALLTPPDVFTQLMLAIPLTLLYELVGIYAHWREKITEP